MTTINKRILSIDILRGLVMVIMALDHVRDFFHGDHGDPMNPDTTTVYLFLTRLVTHFCAPTFVFLSGISAYLSARNKEPKQASWFLVKRGLWLIFAEIVIITFGITFNPGFNIIILQVIWAIGFSMIILGLLSLIGHRAILIAGLMLFFGHNLSTYFLHPSQHTLSGHMINALLTSNGAFVPIGEGRILAIFYAALPWTGAMLLGFSIGKWYNADFEPARRQKLLFYSGLSLFISFLILRYFGWYGNPTPRKEYVDLLKNTFSFLNVSKYPPSLQYYGMTLGPALMLLSGIENVKNRFSQLLMVYGNVPFFYYVAHFYLIHTLLVVLFLIKGYGINDINPGNTPFFFQAPGLSFNLPIVYLIWILVVAILYRPCKWFKQYKATHTQWWLRYL